MAFVASCIEWVVVETGENYLDVFNRMQAVGLIDNYIFPCYDALHTESRQNLTQDIIETLNLWEKDENISESVGNHDFSKSDSIDQKKETARTILRSYKIGRIACIIAQKLQIPPIEALKNFYASQTCSELHDTSSDLYLRGDLYIVNDFLNE